MLPLKKKIAFVLVVPNSWHGTCRRGTFTPANSGSGFRASWPKSVLKRRFEKCSWIVYVENLWKSADLFWLQKMFLIAIYMSSRGSFSALARAPLAACTSCGNVMMPRKGTISRVVSGTERACLSVVRWCLLVDDFIAVKRFFPFQTLKNFVRGCLPWKCWKRVASEIPGPTWEVFCCGFLAFNRKAGMERIVSPSSKNHGVVKHGMSPRLVPSFLRRRMLLYMFIHFHWTCWFCKKKKLFPLACFANQAARRRAEYIITERKVLRSVLLACWRPSEFELLWRLMIKIGTAALFSLGSYKITTESLFQAFSSILNMPL